jgi:hypothetical protein
MIDIGKKITFYFFCEMFENAQFFSHLQVKFAKSAMMTPTFFSCKISIWVPKNPGFFADFKFLDADLNQCPLKAIAPKLCKF